MISLTTYTHKKKHFKSTRRRKQRVHLRVELDVRGKPQHSRNHQLSAITDSVHGAVFHHYALVRQQQHLTRRGPVVRAVSVKGQGGAVKGGGYFQYVMHGRSRMTIYRPSHPYNTGMEHVGFFTDPSLQAGTLLAPSAKKRRGVFGESHEG